MRYITSRELAEKWGISQRRIVRMASDGQIKGAKLYGRSWIFPEDVVKPTDGRTKAGRLKKNSELFRYPLYEYKDLSSFNPPLSDDELMLKAATEAFHACRFKDAYNLLGDLPDRANNRYIRIAALYSGCMISIFLNDIEQFLNYYEKLKVEMQADFSHKSEMNEYVHVLNAALGTDDYYSSEFHTQSALDYHESFLPRLCNLSSLWIALGSKSITYSDLNAIEISCIFLSKTDNYYDLQAVHINLACAYSMMGMEKECHYHFTQALELAEKYDMFYAIATMQFYYTTSSLEAALTDFSPDFQKRVLECNHLVFEHYAHFTDVLQYNSIYRLIKRNDYIYLMFAFQGLTNKEVAKRMHKSIGTVGKHYGEIYALLGVKNKAEAVSLYRNLISNSRLM